jgi:transposase-like protein
MTNTERRRIVAWRFKILQQAMAMPRNVARTCRHVGISRKTYYKWKRRYDEHREAGLCDRARIPHRSPRATPREVVSKILYLHQRNPSTAIDDCTRLRVLRVYDACNQRTAIHFIDEVVRRLRFKPTTARVSVPVPLARRKPGHSPRVYPLRPRTPHLNGKVERSYRRRRGVLPAPRPVQDHRRHSSV